MIVEVEANSNCESGFFGRFKDLGPARPVASYPVVRPTVRRRVVRRHRLE